MRDLVLKEALRTMAADSALALHRLLEAGHEIPYDVAEPGSGSALVQYRPQTARFIRDNAQALTELDSFGAACAALDASGLAAEYLLELGINVPAEPRRRSQLAGIVFACRLWQASTDFTLDDERLETTIEELTDLAETRDGELEVVVPLRGFQMSLERLELTGAMIVRADTVEVPVEAQAADGLGQVGWEPVFLGVVRLDPIPGDEDGSELGRTAVTAFHRLVTTLRLFKEGGVSLGPHAWARSGGDRWRRIATGAGKPRAGGYRLADAELADLAGFSRSLCGPQTPFTRCDDERPGFLGALSRAISRFEAGVERQVPFEALNDQLLALRFLLEGGGPASLSLPMRVAALCAEPGDRARIKGIVDHAIAVERELWSGDPASASGPMPAETAAELEELVRAILKDAACGLLGSDLRSTADEILLADGLASAGAGNGQNALMGETDEWSAVIDRASESETTEIRAIDAEAAADGEPGDERPLQTKGAPRPEPGAGSEESHPMRPTSPIFGPDLEIDLRAVENATPRAAGPREVTAMPEPEPEHDLFEPVGVQGRTRTPHLRAVPAGAERVKRLVAESEAHREEVHSRVSHMFPRPETCEWRIPEVGYDRTRRAEVSLPSVPQAAS